MKPPAEERSQDLMQERGMLFLMEIQSQRICVYPCRTHFLDATVKSVSQACENYIRFDFDEATFFPHTRSNQHRCFSGSPPSFTG